MTSEKRSASKTRRCLTWAETGHLITQLCNTTIIAEAAAAADEIVAVNRGGIIPALTLSHKFNKSLVIIDPFNFDAADLGQNVVVIDNVIDTGNTYIHMKFDFDEWHRDSIVFGSLIRKPWAPREDCIVNCTETSDWIVFPWECS